MPDDYNVWRQHLIDTEQIPDEDGFYHYFADESYTVEELERELQRIEYNWISRTQLPLIKYL